MDETVKDITEHKPSEVKSQIKYMLELIEKCHNCDSKTIEEILSSISNPIYFNLVIKKCQLMQ